ncbi:MAG: hypothetical protein JWN46_2857 [Acidimicrobiales bacterium]|nr:hypothetical protein [Acidimicrobiales bacterium]
MASAPAETIAELYVAFREGDLATVERLMAVDVVFHGTEGHRFGGTVRGRDAFFATFGEMTSLVKAFETETQAIAGDDTVAFGHNLITITRLDGSQVQFHNVTSFRFNERGEICEAFEATTADWASVFPS